MSDELQCAEVEPLLPLVADGVLDVESDPGVFAHLASCPQCQECLAKHDLITLALEGGRPPSAAMPSRVRVVQYRFAWPSAAAAAALVLGVIGFGWWIRAGIRPMTVAEREIIRVREPGLDGSERPMLLIRQGDRTTLVDPAELDAVREGPTGANGALAVPVRMRY